MQVRHFYFKKNGYESGTLNENLFDCFWPNLCATAVFQEFTVFALGDDSEWDGRGKAV
jgi:hypothetical protein